MRKVQVRLPEELIEALTAEASAQDRSLSYVVRKALEAHAGIEGSAPAMTRRTRPILNPKGVCPHPDLGQRRLASYGGHVRDCGTCGVAVPA